MARITTLQMDKFTLLNIMGDIQAGEPCDKAIKNIADDEIRKGHSYLVLNLEAAGSPCTSFVGAVVEINRKLAVVNGYLGIIKPWQEIDILRTAGLYDRIESFYTLDQFKKKKIRTP